MPAIMISAEVGFMPNVTGMSSAIPAEGPMPGSTPMMVPRNTPMKVYQRLIGCMQTAKPLMIWVRVSIAFPSLERQQPGREVDAEQVHEHEIAAGRESQRREHVRLPFARMEVQEHGQEIDAGREHVAQPFEREEEEKRPDRHAGHDLEDAGPGRAGRHRHRAWRSRLASADDLEQQDDGADDEPDRQQPRKSLGPERIADLQAGKLLGRPGVRGGEHENTDEYDFVGHQASPPIATLRRWLV